MTGPAAHRSVGRPRTVKVLGRLNAARSPPRPVRRIGGGPGVREARSRLARGIGEFLRPQWNCDTDGEAAGSSGQGKKRRYGAG